MIIVFADVRPLLEATSGKLPRLMARHGPRLAELEKELQQAREEVQTVREEMQTSQEELKSTNEELQSSNEELTTSKEEMQSLNEELQTVNHELQAKVDELSRSNNDMKNLLNSTDIATLFLDGDLRLRRFTTPTARIIKLIPGDAGRPVTDLVTELDYPALSDDARDVLRTLVFHETTVPARDGRWFTVRIMPYRTLENVIDGLVITFTDATAPKRLEAALREQASEMRLMADSLPALIFRLPARRRARLPEPAVDRVHRDTGQRAARLRLTPGGPSGPTRRGATEVEGRGRLGDHLPERIPAPWEGRHLSLVQGSCVAHPRAPTGES